ncbi:MAG TPA: aspartyl protease family protein [Candidatus Limnocylindria bacterium]|nr:aspartyl protease family protein [Candidatus Limnocylindria bacterium]
MQVLARLPITFTGADGARVHAPLVAGAVGGAVTRLVLDTGSDTHLLTRELADRIGLHLAEGEEGVDHAGNRMPSWSAGTVPMRLAETDLELRDTVVIPAPAPFVASGISGIVSPQRLHPDAWTVIDLVDDELLLVDGDVASIAAWTSERHPELTLLALDQADDAGVVVIRAAIRPFAEMPVLVNTGGRHTEFDAVAVPALVASASERIGGGVSGADVVGGFVTDQTLIVGGVELAVPRLAVRDGMHPPHGMVGMDVLPGSVVICAADRSRPVLWQVPVRQSSPG